MIISLVRTLILYLLVVACLRLLGKRQIGDLQTSELVVTLIVANLASIPVEDTSIPLVAGIVPIITIVFLEMLISVLGLKWEAFRRLVEGNPVIIIENGKLDQMAMKKVRFSTEDLMSSLRQVQVFDLSDVNYAILETNGQLTVLPKKSKSPPDAQSLGVEIDDSGIAVPVISDGVVLEKQLQVVRKKRGWLENILKKEDKKIHEIFLMTTNDAGDYVIIKREDGEK